jgi:hypothetical protein
MSSKGKVQAPNPGMSASPNMGFAKGGLAKKKVGGKRKKK